MMGRIVEVGRPVDITVYQIQFLVIVVLRQQTYCFGRQELPEPVEQLGLAGGTAPGNAHYVRFAYG